ncbi:MFS transporter [Alicyclobacillus ferrooxydans]|uniref:Major facilitator superfamily (MFS) profile domain-containing protein n=1 Tax=Alicyclobacillus ferrooxydans TaxID=471514 RepID=A0A0P9D4S4_9BACL|nr:MFS transporter [Alicyclobacillus ferrooxydans]KPV44446.1 hypothetical protein AN477_07500 [Alicyclobacillus ferrooxydans]
MPVPNSSVHQSRFSSAFTLSASRGLSALGGQIAITILPVAVFLMSHSMALAGLVLGTRLLVSTGFTPISGLFVDRFNPKLLMAISLTGRIILFAVMAQIHAIPWLTLLAAVTAVGGMLESTSTSTLIPRLVPDSALPKVNAIVSSALNLSFIVGPLLGGILVSKASVAWGFYAASGSQILSLICTLYIPSKTTQQEVVSTRSKLEQGNLDETNGLDESSRTESMMQQLLGGIQYAFSDRFLRTMLTAYSVFIFGLTAFNVLALGLSFHFHRGSSGYGLLIAIQAIGMLAITFGSTRWLKNAAVVPMFLLNMPLQGLAMFAIGLSHSFSLVAVFSFLQGLGWGMEQASVMTVLQLHIPRDLQGRIFGLFFASLNIAETLGISVFGWLGQRIGDSNGLLVAGCISTFCAVLSIALLRPLLQPMPE